MSNMTTNELTLNELFTAADEIGAKYQTKDERTESQVKFDAIYADLLREAAERGESDQEKGIWLV